VRTVGVSTDGPRQRRVSARRAPLSRVCGRVGDRVDSVLTLGYPRQAPCCPCPPGTPSPVSFAIRPSWRRPAPHQGHVALSAGRPHPPSSVAIALRAALLGLTWPARGLAGERANYLRSTSARRSRRFGGAGRVVETGRQRGLPGLQSGDGNGLGPAGSERLGGRAGQVQGPPKALGQCPAEYRVVVTRVFGQALQPVPEAGSRDGNRRASTCWRQATRPCPSSDPFTLRSAGNRSRDRSANHAMPR
jgi:hypothetical protein